MRIYSVMHKNGQYIDDILANSPRDAIDKFMLEYGRKVTYIDEIESSYYYDVRIVLLDGNVKSIRYYEVRTKLIRKHDREIQ